MRVTRALLIALILVAVAAGCGGDRAHAPARPPVVTIVQDDAELLHRTPRRIATTMDDLRDLGIDWVRVTAGWSVIAPAPRARRRPDFDAGDPAAYPPRAWSKLDRAVRLAGARGLRVAIDIAFWAPRWAVDRVGGSDAERDSIVVADFADFAAAVARRYPQAVAFTVWNEPNHNAFWLPQWRVSGGEWRPASPHRYRAMVQAAVPRIEAAAPDALVLIGATSSVGLDRADEAGDRMAPLTFLREMACVDERLAPLRRAECRSYEPLPGDGWSHHPYSLALPPWATDPQPSNVRMGDLKRLTALLSRLHDSGRIRNPLGLYLTESGYQTNPPDPTWQVSLTDQARWIAEGEQIARRDGAVRSVAQFLVRDLPQRAGADERARWRDYQSGLRFADGRPKPAHRGFTLALVARRTGTRQVTFWGLVRRGSGRRAVRVSIRGADGSWRTLLRRRTRDDGTFEATVAVEPSQTFRLESGGRSGPALAGAR
ncbi:MAG: cellulase family glycosylhydrolase [Solirubrobacteraceae bacterium]